MARKVFFSFHYARDVMRVMQVRNSWVVRPEGEAQPFYDKAEFEKVKARAGGIEKWIEEQLKGTSCTVVLYGAETHLRKWVGHEIKRSWELKKGLLAIDIHNVRDPRTGADQKGENPLSLWHTNNGGAKSYLSDLCGNYDWVRDNGFKNLPNWIEDAVAAAGRR